MRDILVGFLLTEIAVCLSASGGIQNPLIVELVSLCKREQIRIALMYTEPLFCDRLAFCMYVCMSVMKDIRHAEVLM